MSVEPIASPPGAVDGAVAHAAKSHDPYLDLAAVAIDWPLTPHDRRRLEQHLIGCPPCARTAAAFRADALALSRTVPAA